MLKLPVSTKDFNKLNEKLLGTYEQMSRNVPRKYYDCRIENGLVQEFNGSYVCIIGKMIDIQKGAGASKTYVKVRIQDRLTKKYTDVIWFGMDFLYKMYQNYIGRDFIIYGKLDYNYVYDKFSISHPLIFSDEIEDNQKLIPVYKKIKGISDVNMLRLIQTSCYHYYPEYVPVDILAKIKLPEINYATKMIHYPKDNLDIAKAYQRFIFDEMLYFAIQVNRRADSNVKQVPIFKNTSLTEKVISELPYPLTDDQNNTVRSLMKCMLDGKYINALIQGDVACGKTIVTLLLMFLAVENGMQAVLMAPTEALAKQHYQDLSALAGKYNFRVEFLNGSMTKKQKDKAYVSIKSGETHFIVGTHSVASEGLEYANLGLIAIDEEHKFGVAVKEALKEKSKYNAPYINLSATPIPRSMAETIFGTNKMIFEIKTIPAGRQKVDTICSDIKGIPEILDREINAGRQAYVVCPLIDESDEERNEGKLSVEETVKMYGAHFAGTNIKVAALTGKNSKGKNQDDNVLNDFMQNKIQVLIATTVIEVGINNPNASVIIIQNADLFGLSTLHQLRGRVKRGKHKPYCLLLSEEGIDNPRLKIMCETEDGFKIAEEDFKIRDAGNLLGVEQSGKNKYIDLIRTYPNMYKEVNKIALDLINRNEDTPILKFMSELEEMLIEE